MKPTVLEIRYVSALEDVDPENDNLDVNLHLTDGRVFGFLLATPKNIDSCMANEGIDHFFSEPPPLFVSRLDHPHIEEAFRALLSEEHPEKWLNIYGVLQN